MFDKVALTSISMHVNFCLYHFLHPILLLETLVLRILSTHLLFIHPVFIVLSSRRVITVIYILSSKHKFRIHVYPFYLHKSSSSFQILIGRPSLSKSFLPTHTNIPKPTHYHHNAPYLHQKYVPIHYSQLPVQLQRQPALGNVQ